MSARPWRTWLALALVLAAAAIVGLWLVIVEPEEVAPASSAGPAVSGSSARNARGAPGRAPRGPRQALALSEAKVTDSGGSVGALEGVVVSASDGRGVSGATLTFAAGALTTVRTDVTGRFVFSPEREDVFVLGLVVAAGFLPFAPEWGHSPLVFVAQRGRGLAGARIVLTPALDYVARVLDPSGSPVAGARIRVLGAPSESAALASPTPTDKSGETIFHAPDGAIVEATHETFDPARAPVDLGVQIGKLLELRLRERGSERPRASISGRVVDDRGDAVADALVTARFTPDNPAKPEAQRVPTLHQETDEEGAFELVGLEPGTYALVASASDHAPAVVRGIAAPSRDVVLQLQDGAALHGRVTDASTRAAIPAFAVILSEHVGPVRKEVLIADTFFDASGAYVIPHVPPGRYAVTASAHGYAIAKERVVTIQNDDVEASFALGRGGTVRGRVLDSESQAPLEGARLSLEGRLGDAYDSVPIVASALSDADGRFELGGSSGEPSSILAVAAGHHGRIVGGISVGEGEVHEIVVELTPTKDGEEPRTELVGIGAVLSAKDDALLIGQLLEGGGAAEAGLMPGDAVLTVDGVPVTDLGFGGAIQRIRGAEGTWVVLGIVKAGEQEPRDVPVVRRRIKG